jgi:DNA primase
MREITSEELREIAFSLGKAKEIKSESYQCLCPAHDDNNPSLVISLSRSGIFLAHCFAGCPYGKIFNELKKRNLWPRK